jgi:integrase
MRKQADSIPQFRSVLASYISDFIHEKRTYGYRYQNEMKILRRLDQAMVAAKLSKPYLPQSFVKDWSKRQLHQAPRTHRARITVLRQFARFLQRQGVEAFVPDQRLSPIARNEFSPYIFTREQIRDILTAADQLPPHHRGPYRQLIMPVLFRVLYGCGLRLSEALSLTVANVDLDQGILVIRQGKFRKDRLVPMAPTLTARLQEYHRAMGDRPPGSPFFPVREDEPYATGAIYCIFRRLLFMCGIPHGGRTHGPRVHDLRSTFAVHRLAQWYREGVDLNVKLPVLSTYMGHQSILGTQRYLRLTVDLFADLTERMEDTYGNVIPGEDES